MKVKLEFISGVVFGLEVLPEYKAAMLDLGIIRVFFDWEDENEDEDVDLDE